MLQFQYSCLIIVIIFSCSYVVLVKGILKECILFDCGNIKNITYPFWSINGNRRYCGYPGFGIQCSKGKPFFVVSNHSFIVRNIDYSEQTLSVLDADFVGNNCTKPRLYHTLDLSSSNFAYSEGVSFQTYFTNCDSPPPLSAANLSCPGSTATNRSYIFNADVAPKFDWYRRCRENFVLPVLHNNISNNVSMNNSSTLQIGLELKWQKYLGCEKCEGSGGSCGYDPALIVPGDDNNILCFCKGYKLYGTLSNDIACRADTGGNGTKVTHGSNNRRSTKVTHRDANTWRIKATIGASIGVGIAALVVIILFLYRRNLSLHCRPIYKWSSKAGNSVNVDRFLESYGPLALHRYTYSDLKRFTNSFKDKLGQGGYGSVFKGKLNDGRLVAVKVLTESKGNGEEFINEVNTIGRTNHINVVSLIGFCYEGPKRALVYEYMPNGSLEKFIYNDKSIGSMHRLGWEKLYQIALGIANGLEYLHRGCNTRILHFDIKPHNILLDEDFCPKISDFGLAKRCVTRESIVSLPTARGTMGYIAPEVYCRNFGGVSSKSDVYSFGMMVLEMAGGRQNIDVTANTSEIYFPRWIYDRLEQHGSIELRGFEEIFEEENMKKIIIVGLWCIQTRPADRPSMNMVVEMLHKNVKDLQMPPDPFLDRASSQPSS